MMVASLLVTLFIVHIHFHSCYFSVAPQWLSVLMLQYVAPVICLSKRKQSNRITVSLPQRGEGKQNLGGKKYVIMKISGDFSNFECVTAFNKVANKDLMGYVIPYESQGFNTLSLHKFVCMNIQGAEKQRVPDLASIDKMLNESQEDSSRPHTHLF